MNSVSLVGRLTKDPDVRYAAATQTAIARFTLAVNRPSAKDGEQSADFIGIVCFGKTAELVEKYVRKGYLIGVTGRIQTGSYEKDGQRVYTTDVVADRVEFLDKGGKSGTADNAVAQDTPFGNANEGIPEGFSKLTDDDIPF